MLAPSAWQQLEAAFANAGVTLLDEHKTQIETTLAAFSDADANAIVSALAAHIQGTGIEGLIAPAVRNALVASEPSLDAIINGNERSAFDALVACLQSVAKVAS